MLLENCVTSIMLQTFALPGHRPFWMAGTDQRPPDEAFAQSEPLWPPNPPPVHGHVGQVVHLGS